MRLPFRFLPQRLRLPLAHRIAQRPRRRLDLLTRRLSEAWAQVYWGRIRMRAREITARNMRNALSAARAALKASSEKAATAMGLREQLEREAFRRKAAELELKNLHAINQFFGDRIRHLERGK